MFGWHVGFNDWLIVWGVMLGWLVGRVVNVVIIVHHLPTTTTIMEASRPKGGEPTQQQRGGSDASEWMPSVAEAS